VTLAACGSGTSDTIPTTTTDTRGWSDEAFRDLMAYCQAGGLASCPLFIIFSRDTDQCSVEATYAVLDRLAAIDGPDARSTAIDRLMRNVLQPAGDCLGYRPDDE